MRGDMSIPITRAGDERLVVSARRQVLHCGSTRDVPARRYLGPQQVALDRTSRHLGDDAGALVAAG
jgi:hypothetical protein